jgi:hypothetical protein
MNSVTQTSSQQIFAVVGSAYISERHGDEMHRHLPPKESGAIGRFDKLLKALRTALSLGRRAQS